MHTLQHQPLRPSTILPPTAVSTGPSLPWRTAPRVPGIAAAGASDPAVEQWVWHSRFGPILIEVRGNDVFVNGDRVAPHAP
jgi:hypothetical protein